jgi:hypothetical protein
MLYGKYPFKVVKAQDYLDNIKELKLKEGIS